LFGLDFFAYRLALANNINMEKRNVHFLLKGRWSRLQRVSVVEPRSMKVWELLPYLHPKNKTLP